ncbi:MAG: aminoacyl-tRNA hydrolase [Lachnospiraceae bacterium]|nr:aminoacyl-tRNA hydrolase [Lachnospiraceae bacterium]MBQ4276440.1 aminoacyl-tRNA hydrolase [Lachnospiraceae bacterium]
MFAIIGLGNPGKEYENTRHNAGFNSVDAIAKKYGIDISKNEFKSKVGQGFIDGQKVILVKPQTYMNNSGEAVREVVDFYKLDSTSEIMIIYDDISLDVGMIRVRDKGSAGGHNGIKSIIAHLGSEVFLRIRVGVGDKGENGDLVKHVLGTFKGDDETTIKESYEKAVDAATLILNDNLEKAMNIYNKKVPKKSVESDE